jgi:hypothetical protein
MNPYTKQVYIVDEIYEKDQSMTSVRMIYPRIEALMRKYAPYTDINDDWVKVMDEAAAWFANEVMQQYGVYFMPTDKVHNRKDQGLSLIKDQLIHNLVTISNKCVNLYMEMEQYAKDDQGRIPKRDDHLIDCFRYLNAASNYNMQEVLEGVITSHEHEMSKGRFRRYEDELTGGDDWIDVFFVDF